MVDNSQSGWDPLSRARQRILDVAKAQAADGAHYLWGANGDKPELHGPLGYARSVLTKRQGVAGDTIFDTTFCAAINFVPVAQVGISPFVCAGRCFAVGTPATAIIAKANAPNDAKLNAFIDRYQDKESAQYHWGFELTPRKVRGAGTGAPSDYSGKSLNDALVWGEGCNDTRHFDCWGFVNWVVKQATGIKIARGTFIPSQKAPNGAPIGRYLAKDEPLMPADILVYPGHIAFATGDPLVTVMTTKGPRDFPPLAQAEMGVTGVNYGKAHPAEPTSRVRLNEALLLPGTIAV